MQKIIDETKRVENIAKNSEQILLDLDYQFEKETGLNQTDISIMMLAVGIQIARQAFFSNDKFRISADEGDNLKKPLKNMSAEYKKSSLYSEGKFDLAGFLSSGVPYDAIKTSDLFSYKTGISGTTHRYRTLGHDPILGWIIGPANILTNSLTKTDFDTFYIKNGTIQRRYPLNFVGMMTDFTEVVAANPMLLIAALLKQAIHFGSDYFTKQGLPIPLIATVDNSLSQEMLTKWNVDMYSVTRGSSLSALVNVMICAIHKLFYNPILDNEKIYDVKTRKILMYSNIIATSANLGYVALSHDFKKIDVGGMLVTIYRLINDKKYIAKIKKEFVYGSFKNMIRGVDLQLESYSYEELLKSIES